MTNSKTARFALPLLVAGQAHKESQHNEALTLVDFLMHPVAKSIMDDPAGLVPEPGDCWIIGNNPVGAWQNKPAQIAAWSEGGWRFLTPLAQMAVFLVDMDVKYIFDGENWIAGALIPIPSGGQIIDTEARAAIESLLDMLKQAGILSQS